MTATRAPEVLDWLLDTLPPVLAEIERPPGWEVTVTEGWDIETVQSDTVVIGGWTSEKNEAQQGARYRTETLTFDMFIVVIRQGATNTEVRELALGIHEAISARMRQNPSGLTIGGAVCRAQYGANDTFQYGLTDRGRSCLLQTELTAYEARL